MNKLSRFYNTPLALAASDIPTLFPGMALEMWNTDVLSERPERRGYDVQGGIAVIEVSGVLVHKSTWMWDERSYESISEAFVDAMRDPEVRGLAMLYDSPGGEVNGMFDLADLMYEARGIKPVWAILDENAFSAAYALASAADRIVLPRTGGTGSIGIIAMHMDVTRALDAQGVTVNTITYGSRKADYYPTTPMSTEARKRLQASVDRHGEMFVGLVARNRGVDKQVVRDTEAGTFDAEQAVQIGLADAVMAKDDAFVGLIRATR